MNNRDWKDILKKIIIRKDYHARFLNTLSLMEYIGARKIFKSLNESDVNLEVLDHAHEEVRHAKFLKQAAIKVGEGNPVLETYNDEALMAGDSARNYMKRVDKICEDFLEMKLRPKNYILSSLIIEERAIRFYGYYHLILKEINHGVNLLSLFKEEEKHLKEMRNSLEKYGLDKGDFDICRKEEEKAFSDYIGELGAFV